MRFISLTVALTLTLASLVSASPVPIGDADIPTPVDKRTVVTSVPTVVPAPDPTDGGDLTPDFVKTKCQKQCVKAYPECVAANPLIDPGVCKALEILCEQCCILPNNPGCTF